MKNLSIFYLDSLKSRDSGLSPEPSYEKTSNENSEYMVIPGKSLIAHFFAKTCYFFHPQHPYVKLFFLPFQLHALNSDMIEMRSRLQKSDLEKEELKMQIHKLFEEKKNFERHLEAISSAHDSRITEMHCVIGTENFSCEVIFKKF
jgi:hypothetical protein